MREMPYAYTPGLKIKKAAIVRKRRVLPIKGDVLVKEEQSVSYGDVVARTYVPGDVQMQPVAYSLGIEPKELPHAMSRKVGDEVKEGEIIAVSKAFFGKFKKEVQAKTSGTIELISEHTGFVAIRTKPTPVEVNSYINGKVVKIIPNFGAEIETPASFIQGIFGIGGERQGKLEIIADRSEAISPDKVGRDCAGKIIAGGSLLTYEVLRKAVEVGAKGVVTGGVRREDLTSFLGYEIGVAITGQEEVGLTCIVTEGFGKMAMAGRTYDLLKSLDGKVASIDGATQIRAGVVRPEIIVPTQDEVTATHNIAEGVPEGMKVGMLVRVIRKPYFGRIGRVQNLPFELQTLESESKVRVMVVTLEDSQQITVPRANVEIMEE
jgi:hypothetical protein